MVIITQLTQVRKEKNGKINFRLGIEPSTQRLGVQYTQHQAITQDNQCEVGRFANDHWQYIGKNGEINVCPG